MLSANSINKFPAKCTYIFPSLLPPMTNNGSLFIPNSRTQFVKPIRCSDQPEFNFNAYRLEKLNSINQALEKAVPLKESSKLHEVMRYTLLSDGTRIGSFICIACCELVGGDESTVMPVACGMEFLETAWIIIDELSCMDNHDFRRGKPSNHKVFGESNAILASYSLFALTFEHITKVNKLGVSSANIVRVLSEVARLMGAEGVATGEAADMQSKGKSGIGIEQVEYIYLHKTSAAIETCVVAGAIIGGASEEEINKLRKYGKYSGLLFQIKDDILDYEEDMIIGKATYPKLIGKEKLTEMLEKLIKEAEDQLIGFNPNKAAPLKALLRYIGNMQE